MGVNILEDVRHSSVLYVHKYFVGDRDPKTLDTYGKEGCCVVGTGGLPLVDDIAMAYNCDYVG